MSGDRSRLPKWAQAELERLERGLEAWKERCLDGPADTDTIIEPYWDYSDGGGGKPLHKGARVRFKLGESWRDYVDVRVDEHGRLDVGGGDGLAIYPASGNHVYIKSERS